MRGGGGKNCQMPTSSFEGGGGILLECRWLPTVGGEGSKIVKICRRLKWMVPNAIFHYCDFYDWSNIEKINFWLMQLFLRTKSRIRQGPSVPMHRAAV